MPEREMPFSQACENNKKPISEVLEKSFSNCQKVLEIGSGTGQHAVYFASKMPRLTWYCADQQENIKGINQWLDEVRLPNIQRPFELDVDQYIWPCAVFNAGFSANTAHIMSWQQVKKMLRGMAYSLTPGGVFCLYGPFNYNGQYTSVSNARFDDWLKAQAAHQGIRDFEKIVEVAKNNGMKLLADHVMPSNNRCLEFVKS